MAKATRVRGIRPSKSLRENAAKIVEVRLGELLSWEPALGDPSKVQDLHNMRIAAKRLRYALETFQLCFPDAKPIVKDLSDIQEALGDIHDLDVLTDVLRNRLRVLHEPLEGGAVEITSQDLPQRDKSARLRRLISSEARDVRRLGLLGLLGDKVNERGQRFEAFRKTWDEKRLQELETMTRRAIAPPGDATGLVVETVTTANDGH